MTRKLFFVFALIFSGWAVAGDDDAYISVGGSLVNADTSIDDDALILAGFIAGGGSVASWAHIEARYGMGILDEEAGEYDVEISKYWSVYAKIKPFELGIFVPYLLLGSTKAKFSFCLDDDCSIIQKTDISYGLGATFKIGRSHAINAELVKFIDLDEVDARALSVSYSHYF